MLINYTEGRNFSFVTTPLVNNFERSKIISNSLNFSQGGTVLQLCGPSQKILRVIFHIDGMLSERLWGGKHVDGLLEQTKKKISCGMKS